MALIRYPALVTVLQEIPRAGMQSEIREVEYMVDQKLVSIIDTSVTGSTKKVSYLTITIPLEEGQARPL